MSSILANFTSRVARQNLNEARIFRCPAVVPTPD